MKPTLRYAHGETLRLFCPQGECRSNPRSPDFKRPVRHGVFYRSSDRNFVTRYRCPKCRGTFSSATLHPCFRQKKRQLNFRLWFLLCSKVHQRRVANFLGIHRTTVARRMIFLGREARLEHARFLKRYIQANGRFPDVQFDEMESFEHTKCKPVSIPLVVSARSRFVLGVNVASMPAKGPLAKLALRKYGPREDHRVERLVDTLEKVRSQVHPECRMTSDSHPFYPPIVRQLYPQVTHVQVKGRKSAIVGQGELKKVGFDPIFSLNHTAAMKRDGIGRLVRKTWTTTKKKERLLDHLYIYAVWHNQNIWEKLEAKARRARARAAGAAVA